MQNTFTVGNLTVTRLCSKEEMDIFVDKLSPEKKTDVKHVLRALIEAGLIEVQQEETVKH